MSDRLKPRCPWRKPPKHEFDRADRIANVVIGMLFGVVLVGIHAFVAFPALVANSENMVAADWFILCGLASLPALLFGILGHFFGDPFLDWMRDNFHRFFTRSHG